MKRHRQESRGESKDRGREGVRQGRVRGKGGCEAREDGEMGLGEMEPKTLGDNMLIPFSLAAQMKNKNCI